MKPTLSHADLLRRLNYDPETGLFTWKYPTSRRVKTGQFAGMPSHSGYWKIIISDVEYSGHRLAWFYTFGVWPSSDLDHRDGNKANNRIINLRLATVSQNAANRKTPVSNTSGFKGVRARENNRWRAVIEHGGKQISLGTYGTREEAHAAYCGAAERLFGEFARAS